MNKTSKIILQIILLFIIFVTSTYLAKALEVNVEGYVLKGDIKSYEMKKEMINKWFSKEVLNVEIANGEIKTPFGNVIIIKNKNSICHLKFVKDDTEPIDHIKINGEVGIELHAHNTITYSCDNNQILGKNIRLENINLLKENISCEKAFIYRWEDLYIGIKIDEKGLVKDFSYKCGNFSKLNGEIILASGGRFSFYKSGLGFMNETFVKIENSTIIIEANKTFELNGELIKSNKPVKIKIEKDKKLGYISSISMNNVKFGNAIVNGEIAINSVGGYFFNNKLILKDGSISYLDGNLIIKGKNLFILDYDKVLIKDFNKGKILFNFNEETEEYEFKDFKKEGFQAIGINSGIILSDNANVVIDCNGQKIVVKNGKPKINIKSDTKIGEIREIEVSEYSVEIDNQGITIFKEKDKKYPVTVININPELLAKPALKEFDFFYSNEAREAIPTITVAYIPSTRFFTKSVGIYDPKENKIILSNAFYGIKAARAGEEYKEKKFEKFETAIHEAAHAIWFNYVKKEIRDSFDKDIDIFLNEKTTSSETIKHILHAGYEEYQKELREEYIKQIGHKLETVEGWAFISAFIYLNCKGLVDYKFPDYILKYYEGIIAKECLDKAREKS